MKKTVFTKFLSLTVISAIALLFAGEALAAAKTRTLVQTDISNNKLREYNAEKLYDTLTTINDSALNLSTDDLSDIAGGAIGAVTPATGPLRR